VQGSRSCGCQFILNSCSRSLKGVSLQGQHRDVWVEGEEAINPLNS
jgi:hypothetical protein